MWFDTETTGRWADRNGVWRLSGGAEGGVWFETKSTGRSADRDGTGVVLSDEAKGTAGPVGDNSAGSSAGSSTGNEGA